MRPFNLLVHEEDLTLVLTLVRLNAGAVVGLGRIATKWQEQLDSERTYQSAKLEAEEADRKLRESRAVNATLTERQAQALAAIRAGKSPYDTWTPYRNPILRVDGTHSYGHWVRSRSMGGAVNRMIETLKDEGLIEPRGWALTAGGRERLEAWEAKHKKRLGEPLPTPLEAKSIPELMMELHEKESSND
jgi:hypothetical protein